MLQEGPRAHVCDMFNILQWNTLDVRSNIHVANMVFKCLKGDAPFYLKENFSRVSDHHTYNTKSNVNGSLKQFNAKTQSGQRTFNFRGVAAWNNLPTSLRSINLN